MIRAIRSNSIIETAGIEEVLELLLLKKFCTNLYVLFKKNICSCGIFIERSDTLRNFFKKCSHGTDILELI